MQLDHESDRDLLLTVMSNTQIMGSNAIRFASLMQRIATAEIPPSVPILPPAPEPPSQG